MPPFTYSDWLEVARERTNDVDVLIENRELAAVYMAGYVIECNLKAYLQRNGIPFPTSGREGHDLRALWDRCNWRIGSAGASGEAKRYFFEEWSVNLRYEISLSESAHPQELIAGAKQLTGWIQGKTKNARPRRRR